ncbi:DUF5050 domain-containing protein [Sporomusa malonica]|uniref:N-acetylmuramoyl-L-alanine amidase n=1 Tax=Sporomusa malonica TaxID=112901 RepID=A0A1W2DFY7_9FIRM|nr:DUF5050 domain-containing protein [Sporomusa malonica]SMC96042.1 N-acetylmuramoyl-L-alanine amidase [Sporomusa malonica]
MPVFISLFPLLVAIVLLLSPAPAIASMPELLPKSETPAATELKLFHLEHKDVIAIAAETRLPAADIADPLAYKLEPVYHLNRQDNLLEITLAARPFLPELTGQITFTKSFASPRLRQLTMAATSTNELKITAAYNSQTTKTQLTTVKRKRVTNPDNTITFRTYLVISFIDKESTACAEPLATAKADAALIQTESYTFLQDTTTGTPPKTIVLDPGHGGAALGATSNFLFEKELNLDIALLTRDLFQNLGYDVIMTRTDDSNPSLLDRADTANILNADALISIHNNSMPEDMPDPAKKLYRGTTALYNSSAPKPGKELASLLADELAGTLRIHQYPLQDRPGLVVLNSSWVPTVIAEVAMMPHPQDAKMISQRVYRLEAAQAIVQATEKYFKISDTAPLATATPPTITTNSLAVSDPAGTRYYLDLAGDIYAGGREAIYRLKPDEHSPTMLTDDEAWNLNISGKYLYYSNWSDKHRIYRLNLDGTEKIKITDEPANQVTVAGDWLVYIKWTNNKSAQDNNIYKTSLDGRVTQKINSDQSENLSVIGDWVYYLNASDGYKIYKIKLDGTGRTKIAEDQAVFMAAAGNTIYYSNYNDSQKLYAISTEGRNRVKLANDKAGFITVANGNIYYTNASANHAVYRINVTGQNRQMICDLGAGPLPITVLNNVIYYNHLFLRL